MASLHKNDCLPTNSGVVDEDQRCNTEAKSIDANPLSITIQASCEEQATAAEDGETGSGLYLAPCLSLRHVSSATSEILPHLLISTLGDGILEDEQFLHDSDIKFVVNCCEQDTHLGGLGQHLVEEKDFTVLHLNLKDDSTQQLNAAFDQFLPLVQRAKEENKKCLISCHSGMSRSVSLVLGYLLACESMSLIEALTHVKERRQIASPNPGFMAQLIQLERSLRENATIDLERYRNDRFGDPLSFSVEIRASFDQGEHNSDTEEELEANKGPRHRRTHSRITFVSQEQREGNITPGGRQAKRHPRMTYVSQVEPEEDKENNSTPRRGHKRVQSDISIVFVQGNEKNKPRGHKRSGSDISIFFSQAPPVNENNPSNSHKRFGSDISICVKQKKVFRENDKHASRCASHSRSNSDISIFLRKVFEDDGEHLEGVFGPKAMATETENSTSTDPNIPDFHERINQCHSDISISIRGSVSEECSNDAEEMLMSSSAVSTPQEANDLTLNKDDHWSTNRRQSLPPMNTLKLHIPETSAHKTLKSPGRRTSLPSTPTVKDGSMVAPGTPMSICPATPKTVSGPASNMMPVLEEFTSFVSNLMTCASALDLPVVSLSNFSFHRDSSMETSLLQQVNAQRESTSEQN